jgi:hypothetical protein
MLGCEGIDWWIVALKGESRWCAGSGSGAWDKLPTSTDLKHLDLKALFAQILLAEALEG